MLGPLYIGKTMLLMNGEEDVITGSDAESLTFSSETRVWDKAGISADGDPEQSILGPKQVHIWKLEFVGYGPTDGSYTARTLMVSNQHLALRAAKAYNDRVKDHRPNENGSFVQAGVNAVTSFDAPARVFDDALAHDVITSDEVYDVRWMRNQRANEGPSLA